MVYSLGAQDKRTSLVKATASGVLSRALNYLKGLIKQCGGPGERDGVKVPIGLGYRKAGGLSSCPVLQSS